MKNERTTILLVDSNDNVRNALNYMLRSNFNFNVIDVDTDDFDYSLKVLRTQKIGLVITEHSEKIDGLSLLSHLNDQSIPFICTCGTHPEVQQLKDIIKLERSNCLTELKKFVDGRFEVDPKAELDNFTAVPFKTLVAFPGIANHVFIELKSGRRLKIYQQGDRILPADVQRYAQKGVSELWLDKKAYLWVLKKLESNFANMVEDEDFSFDEDAFDFDEADFSLDEVPLTDDDFNLDFDESPKKKAVVSNEILTMAEELKRNKVQDAGSLNYDQMFAKDKKKKPEYKMETVKVTTMDDLDRELAELQAGYAENPFTKEEEFLKEVSGKVQSVLKKVSQNRNMAALFKNLKINREDGSYLKTRINLVVHISTTVAKELQWASPATYEKLIYVAHVHDIALFERPHLARAQSVIDLEIMKAITDEDKHHFLPHVEKAVAIVRADPWAPEGADKIIEQHHERPDKSGFPNQLAHQRVVPFAALLAISIDCAQYMIDNPNWDLDAWLDKNDKKWKGGSYTKVMGGLRKLAQQISKAA